MTLLNDSGSVDGAVKRVHANKEKWAALSVRSKLDFIEKIRRSFAAHIETYKQVCVSKRLPLTHPDGKKLPKEEETFSKLGSLVMNAMVFSNWLYGLHKTYNNIVKTSRLPSVKYIPTTLPEVTRVKVGPSGFLQNLFLPLGSIELFIEGEKKQTLPTIQTGAVSVILGAGNYDAPIDLLHALFILNNVCVYKISPMSNALYPVMRAIFEPLISEGYMEILRGEAAEGYRLVNHSSIDRIIMTGSRITASTLYWGSPSPPLKSLALKPTIAKNFIFECGNCTPWLICPSEWTALEMGFHTRHIAFAIVLNGGHICAHPQLLITCKGWPQREVFLESIKAHIRNTPLINTFYPNFKERMAASKEECRADGKLFNTIESAASSKGSSSCPQEDTQKILFIEDLKKSTFLTREEMFCAVVGEVALDTPNKISDFLQAGVEFVNSECEGNLCCSITAKTKNPEDEEALEKAIESLKYGSILLNVMPSVSIIFPQIVWGAYGEFDPHCMQSGKGHFGNCYGYIHPLKSVVRTPFLNPFLLFLSISHPKFILRIERTLNQMCLAFCEASSGIRNFFWMNYRFSRILFSLLFGI
ncbi:aldehyde dehydrogenase [Cardiosporidium cionae]|uniref:Aldehyde dehydrogenase n=1 Tax=Cardiosporidium cionae TaxID=476202 RepID=A0ABQ7J4D5_9APIC|nr:aldehyde dehydrogenase [Cardiosporidium cionae]|eukprot:KAF8817994.1 aldehyde dehydrogenase [Cardiosporidium cionae]